MQVGTTVRVRRENKLQVYKIKSIDGNNYTCKSLIDPKKQKVFDKEDLIVTTSIPRVLVVTYGRSWRDDTENLLDNNGISYTTRVRVTDIPICEVYVSSRSYDKAKMLYDGYYKVKSAS